MTDAYPAPDNHFPVGPHCCVRVSGSGRIASVRGCPTIRARIVSSADVQVLAIVISAPDNHFRAGPDCRMIVSECGRVGRAGGCPSVTVGIVFAASIQSVDAIEPAPHDHFTAGPTRPCERFEQ